MQVEAHHFCACPNEDVRQCVIYDSDKPNARLIGLEYIISDQLFETLPEEEKIYWHSHKYEVQSGTLQVCPRIKAWTQSPDGCLAHCLVVGSLLHNTVEIV